MKNKSATPLDEAQSFRPELKSSTVILTSKEIELPKEAKESIKLISMDEFKNQNDISDIEELPTLDNNKPLVGNISDIPFPEELKGNKTSKKAKDITVELDPTDFNKTILDGDNIQPLPENIEQI